VIILHIPGTPPRKNERHDVIRIGNRGALKNSKAFDELVAEVAAAWLLGRHQKICSGKWEIHVRAVWPRKRNLDVTVAFGDVDAPVSAVLDALQACGAIDDDARFIRQSAEKLYVKGEGSTEIRLREVVA
jgi:Holliday junction resolvase RusA-like endonuclease